MALPSHALPSPIDAAGVPEVINHTPWPSQYFQHVDPHGDIFHVMVTRISYSLLQLQEKDGRMEPVLLPPERQLPLCQADQFQGEVNETSLLQESDYAPFKPRCDVLVVNATAHAPDGKALARWPVGFRFGDAIEKTFQVTGPRRFVRSVAALGALQLTEPEPTDRVRIGYELAFGGPHLIRQERLLQRFIDSAPGSGVTDAQRHLASQAHAALPPFHGPNPIGCGRLPTAVPQANEALAQLQGRGSAAIAPPETQRTEDVRRAPQIEDFQQPYTGQSDYPVVGLGPVGRWWSPRVALAGTHDERWKQTQWPRSPLDHDYRYWNCAPEDQQIDYPQGGEEVVLAHFTAAARHAGPYRFWLPRQDLQLLVRLKVGVLMFAPMHIDTVILDLEAGTLSIVRRAVVSAKADVRQLELGTWPAGTGVHLDEAMQKAAQARRNAQVAGRGQ
ncbi:DUF2169 domain-containing protein [Acidovorax sp. SUPP950]|uniref:DUF2169 family type VI secretion system accessory protein n=1 Tax=Acidovorax sp. SUPP950 TaxID=511901 RepID=UPI0023CED12C|nr:DUF2169 domain-containing protein [Acidovorax sp. SUPP950]GKS75577.1 DUF2169 domain-containing protein [Acidovorax sp. SUPP950]